jgi:hypothetical protein
MEAASTTTEQEIQVAPSILKLKKIKTHHVNWYDTGSEEGLKEAREHYEGIQNLDKLDEELYVVNSHVVKYFHNANMVSNRLERAKRLGEVIPEIVDSSENFYKYKFVDGKDLYKWDNQHEFIGDLLDYTKSALWTDKPLEGFEKTVFKDACKKFYYDKTLSRLDKLHKKLNIVDQVHTINGDSVDELDYLFKRINWDYIADGIPGNFHGDYNLSNIVLGYDKKFKFLDWRQDFAGLVDYGDRHYDLAKMYHSFLFPHPSIKANKFYIKKSNRDIKTFVEVPVEIEKAKDVFEEFVEKEGYDLWKVKILTAIVLLNMSPLHESPVDEYLYYYGKWYLRKHV